MIENKKAPARFRLAHTTLPISYEFWPSDQTVLVVHTSMRAQARYALPVDEARALWRRLLGKGYERF